MKEWLGMTAADLGRGIGSGEIDPVALTETYLEAIGTHRFADRVYARLTEDRARSEAAAAAERANSGHRLSLLDGVPISWKDLYDTAGVATEAGSALLEGRVPERDAEVLRNAAAMGLVCLGKTHMSELAFSGLGLNPVTATTPCVNNTDAVSGGSSSGAAGSVAFYMAAAGIGSDTGGSVRVPAGWNDLVGLKTTAGRVPLTGVVELAARFDTVGPLCRSVEDASLLLAALEGRSPIDLTGADVTGLRFAALQSVALDDLDPQQDAAHRNALRRLSDAGARIEEVAMPDLADAMALAPILYTSEAYGTWKDQLEAHPDKVFKEILERFRAGAAHGAADYVAAWQKLERIRDIWAGTFAGYDGVLMPTTPNMPPDLERLNADEEYYKSANLMTLRNTRIGNLMGLCGLTLPTGIPSCGLMVLGAPMQEEALLRTGVAIEAALA